QRIADATAGGLGEFLQVGIDVVVGHQRRALARQQGADAFDELSLARGRQRLRHAGPGLPDRAGAVRGGGRTGGQIELNGPGGGRVHEAGLHAGRRMPAYAHVEHLWVKKRGIGIYATSEYKWASSGCCSYAEAALMPGNVSRPVPRSTAGVRHPMNRLRADPGRTTGCLTPHALGPAQRQAPDAPWVSDTLYRRPAQEARTPKQCSGAGKAPPRTSSA